MKARALNISRDFVVLIIALAMTAMYDILKDMYNKLMPVKLPSWDILFAFVVTTLIIILIVYILPKKDATDKSTRVSNTG